jgi:hypothetical protein
MSDTRNRILLMGLRQILIVLLGIATECQALESSVDSRTYGLLAILRRALIIAIGGLEDHLDLERSITPRHKLPRRDRPRRQRPT